MQLPELIGEFFSGLKSPEVDIGNQGAESFLKDLKDDKL